MKNIIITLLFLFIFTHILWSNEAEVKRDPKTEEYLQKRITYRVNEKFDQRYPGNIKIYTFYQGEKKMTEKEFLNISQDQILMKNKEKVKRIKIAGFSTAAVFGGATTAFLIPSVIFIYRQTNFYPVDDSYTFSGVAMCLLSGISLAAMFVDLIVTFALIYKHQYNEYSVREAVEKYNSGLRKKLGLIPDISYYQNDIRLEMTFKI